MSEPIPDFMPPELISAIREMSAIPGIYVLTDSQRPGSCVPVVSLGGKIFAMTFDQELAQDRFLTTCKITGPIWRGGILDPA